MADIYCWTCRANVLPGHKCTARLWKCPRRGCSLLNPVDRAQCGICWAPRPSSAATPTPALVSVPVPGIVPSVRATTTTTTTRQETPAETIPHYMAIDIEARGPNLIEHPVVALGLHVAPVDRHRVGAGTFRISRKWAMKPLPGQVDQPECMRDFWSCVPVLHQWVEHEARDPVTVMTEFAALCDGLVRALGVGNVTLLAGNPAFDLGRLDVLGAMTKTWPAPIRYLRTAHHHEVCVPTERFKQLDKATRDAFHPWLLDVDPAAVSHGQTHFPDADARYIYHVMQYCDEQRARLDGANQV
jgi:hypothetical protein